MGEFTVENKSVAVPGELLAKGMDCFPSFGTYRDGENIYASRLGLININGKVVKMIPLTGAYLPKIKDVIIGEVVDILMSGWRLEINSAYSAMLSLKDGTSEFVARGADLSKYHKLGDYVMTSVINVTSQKLIDLSMRGPGLRKLAGGRIIKVNSHKVPRVIGKHGSMVSMIKTATNCQILVGQNGLIWLSGEPKSEVIAANTIQMIEDQAHVSGLTDKIKVFLEKATGKKVVLPEFQDKENGASNENQSNNKEFNREFNQR